jgi:hypothetical protein
MGRGILWLCQGMNLSTSSNFDSRAGNNASAMNHVVTVRIEEKQNKRKVNMWL